MARTKITEDIANALDIAQDKAIEEALRLALTK